MQFITESCHNITVVLLISQVDILLMVIVMIVQLIAFVLIPVGFPLVRVVLHPLCVSVLLCSHGEAEVRKCNLLIEFGTKNGTAEDGQLRRILNQTRAVTTVLVPAGFLFFGVILYPLCVYVLLVCHCCLITKPKMVQLKPCNLI